MVSEPLLLYLGDLEPGLLFKLLLLEVRVVTALFKLFLGVSNVLVNVKLGCLVQGVIAFLDLFFSILQLTEFSDLSSVCSSSLDTVIEAACFCLFEIMSSYLIFACGSTGYGVLAVLLYKVGLKIVSRMLSF